MFDITAIFSAISNFFQFMMKWWVRSDEAKKKQLYDQLETLKKQIQNETDEIKLNALLEKKAAIVKQIAALGNKGLGQ
jgi:hypothetical protein